MDNWKQKYQEEHERAEDYKALAESYRRMLSKIERVFMDEGATTLPMFYTKEEE